jgi:O-acetyl-ADP-ribose deacetylase (regulator of RNase III)
MTVYIYHGDITNLKVQSITNASNESGLGCSIPGHCIDSAIHAAAGPKLLDMCKTFKNGIPTGHVEITPGFNLPSKYILHVTGPKKNEKTGKCDFQMLRHCYQKCLKVAHEHKITEIAFCCLSIGIFGFPKQESAQVAIDTVLQSPYATKMSKLIFCVYTEQDLKIYKNLLNVV